MPTPPKPAPKPLRPVVPRPAGATTPAAAAAVVQTLAQAQAGSAARRREAEALLQIVLSRRSRVGADFFEMGRALTALLDGKLYVALGHPTFAAMLEQRKLMSQSVATRLIAVWRSIPKETALQLGPERAFEWLRLLRAQAACDGATEDVQTLAQAPPQVDGTPIVDLSIRQLAELRRRTLERLAEARADPGTPEAHRVARALAQRLQRVGVEDAEVEARYSRGGWCIRVDLSVESAAVLTRRIS